MKLSRFEFVSLLFCLGSLTSVAPCFNCKSWHLKRNLRALRTPGGTFYFCRECDDQHARAAGLDTDEPER